MSASLQQYLAAIGLDPSVARQPSLALLQELYLAHITTLPFNAIEVYEGGRVIELQLGKPTATAAARLFQRGGLCFELTAVVLDSLKELGFTAYRGAGEVFTPDGAVTVHLVHSSIIVQLDGEEYLMDVGMPSGPFGIVKLEEGTVQTMSNGSKNVMTCQREEGQPLRWVLNREGKEGELVPIHRFQAKAYTDSDGELSAARDFLYAEEGSPFRHGWMLQIFRPDGACVTLAEGSWAGASVPAGQAKYVVRPAPNTGSPEVVTHLPADGEEVARLLREVFHIEGQSLPIKKGPVEGLKAAPSNQNLAEPAGEVSTATVAAAALDAVQQAAEANGQDTDVVPELARLAVSAPAA